MRYETKESSIKLVEKISADEWAVRWDFREKLDENEESTGINWYEQDVFNHIPEMLEIQGLIIDWYNKVTDSIIKHGFVWNDVEVLLNEENKFNYKAIVDETEYRETLIKKWDEENPELAGKEYIEEERLIITPSGDEYVVPVSIPTGRPKSLLPVTLKLGQNNTPENFYVFNTLEELRSFFSAGVDHLLGAYARGWERIAQMDWSVYEEALRNLD